MTHQLIKKTTVISFLLFGFILISYIYKQDLLLYYYKVAMGNEWESSGIQFTVDDSYVIVKRSEEILSMVSIDLGYKASINVKTNERDNNTSISIVGSAINEKLINRNDYCDVYEIFEKGPLPDAIVFMNNINLISWVYFDKDIDVDKNRFFDVLCNSIKIASNS